MNKSEIETILCNHLKILSEEAENRRMNTNILIELSKAMNETARTIDVIQSGKNVSLAYMKKLTGQE